MADKIQLTLRLDPDMHRRVAREAELQDRSAASLITHYIRRGLDQDDRRREDERDTR